MDDFAEKISSILSDEESMKQIGELAAMLGLGNDNGGNAGSNSAGNPAAPTVPAVSDNSQGSPFAGLDMGALMGLAGKLRCFQADDDNTRFLMALRPLLGEEKRNKIDRAVKILRLLNFLPLVKDSGLLGGDFLGIL